MLPRIGAIARPKEAGRVELLAELSGKASATCLCQEGVGPHLPGGSVIALLSPPSAAGARVLLSLEQMSGLPTDLSLRSQDRPEGAPDRCQVQRESQESSDSQKLSTKGPRVTGEKQGQMGPASPCQQGSLR